MEKLKGHIALGLRQFLASTDNICKHILVLDQAQQKSMQNYPACKEFRENSLLFVDLSELLENEVTATLTLEEEKDRILNRPRRDPDFIR